MKKFKFPLMLVATCIALAASFAFKMPGAGSKKVDQYFYSHTSTDFAEMGVATNWTGQSEPGGCDEELGTIPCYINCSGDLQTELTTLGSVPAILAVAPTKRYP